MTLLTTLGDAPAVEGQEALVECTAPDGQLFVCGQLALYLEPSADVDVVLDACDPPPLSVTASGSDAATGTLIYHLEVPMGSELDLRECYEAQIGTEAAELYGVGELTPNTAVPPPSSWVAVGLLLLCGAALLAWRSRVRSR
ncbi:MAG TPA: hypothetical protein VHR55_07970 [Candidatus Limnocylindria bacterium]|nr:hypothetical protein [Candidatus Limnocylindria bacterium]